MCKLNYIFYFYLLLFINNVDRSQSMIQCYLCADCGDPFSENYPYTSVITNQNYGAACIKTVLTVPSGKVVSRGTTFNCVPASTSDIKIYCCQSNLCNQSNSFKHSVFILFLSFGFTFYRLFN